SESALSRWGGSSLVAAKFLPGVSTVAAPMAGALGMSWGRFLAFDLGAAVLWSLAFLVPGMLFSEQIVQILDALARAGVAALIALVLLLSAFLALRYLRRQALLRDAAMPRISVDDLHELIRQGADPIIIDVRSHESVRADPRQIPGAITVPLGEVASRAAGLPRDREIVLYCNCPNEVSAALGARALMAQGIERARPLYGGLEAWFARDEEAWPSAASSAAVPGGPPRVVKPMRER
ncbi:MAG: DedA family protein/thiosulfate sulfurtransferase GlpE, partial [Gammaproteobacteria bacterium]